MEILKGLRLTVEDVTAESCKVICPLFRLDLTREADLAEEVARIDGLDKIPAIQVQGKSCHSSREDVYTPIRKIRDCIIGMGYYECIHYSIVSTASALADKRFTKDDLIELSNPLSPDSAWMRPGLFGEMVATVGRNLARGNRDMKLFELDKAFCKNPAKYPEERYELLMLLTGRCHPERFSAEGEADYDFYDIKGEVEVLLERLNIRNYRLVIPENNDGRFADKCVMELQLEGKTAGFFGELAPEYSAKWRNAAPVFFAQIDFAKLLAAAEHSSKSYKELPQYPGTARDIAFVAPADLESGTVLEFLRRCKVANLESVRLFDIFVDDALKAQGKKSMAYSLNFRNKERTLTDTEVNAAMDKVRSRLAAELNVELR